MKTTGTEEFVPQPHDLEQITVLLALGAIYLTNAPGDEFTFEELLASAREASCGTFELEEADVRIVGISWLCKKMPNGKYRMK